MERSLSDASGRRAGGPEHADRAGAVVPGGRPAPSVNVYVDGFNLYYGCLRGTEYQWLDIGALCRRLLPAHPINHIRYFTSRVAARPDAPNRPEQQNAYLRALGTVEGLSIHLGHFQSTEARLPAADALSGEPRIVKVTKTQEKGSDVNLATFMLLDAFRKESDIAVVISNDSDLREPIRVLIEELGVPVGLGESAPGQEAQPGAARAPAALLQASPALARSVPASFRRCCATSTGRSGALTDGDYLVKAAPAQSGTGQSGTGQSKGPVTRTGPALTHRSE